MFAQQQQQQRQQQQQQNTTRNPLTYTLSPTFIDMNICFWERSETIARRFVRIVIQVSFF